MFSGLDMVWEPLKNVKRKPGFTGLFVNQALRTMPQNFYLKLINN